ncbi:hypothetical protein V493_05253 [Pseudogymnoascus sp. VKM F-4281 (FW-2241)]|nr:hypothetical protein V493_05253 [Pseudogymnoascus sp. VKM F-4281 (FW-2241)]
MSTPTPQTPRRTLLRPRPSLTKVSGGINTVSTPNLSSAYSNAAAPPVPTLAGSRVAGLLARKTSLSALTQGSLATIPDASETYGLSTVLDEDSLTTEGQGNMTQHTPRGDDGEVEVGELVDVPGHMHGTVKFLGTVAGKKGVFAGVELSEEYSARGKNNGDVDGVSYFKTSIPGAGIFLPVARATRRSSRSTSGSSFPHTPTSSRGGQGYQTYTPPTPSLPNFSQSLGPGRAPSPQFKRARPSLPRPESPLRLPQASRPSITATPGPKGAPRYAPSPSPAKFGQSVRGTRDTAGDPPKKLAFTPRNPIKSSGVGPRSASALGGAPMNYSDDETTPIGTARTTNNNDSLGSTSSFNAKLRPAEARAKEHEEDLQRLRTQLEERDKQLKEQASSLAEMENSLAEVQSLMGGSDAGSKNRGSMEDRDTSQLRTLLREKNEKIAMLTSEFDAHRADFRSTIDTLEMASNETERVYEKRVEDLVQELREHQDRSDDVHSVAAQLKQLEELVQELEEGLEDARRGESEARGEVEFLRGEVERGRAELRREREKAAAAQESAPRQNDASSGSKDLEQRDDEIRGLKAIIHSLSRDQVPDADPQKTPTQRHGSVNSRNQRQSQVLSESAEDRQGREALESEVAELRRTVESKSNREEELQRELEELKRGSTVGSFKNQRTSAITIGSTGTVTADKQLNKDVRSSVGSWRDRPPGSPETHRRGNTLETMAESDTYSATTEGSVLWCEICETGGHDILTCTNMFGAKSATTSNNTGSHLANNPNPPAASRNGRDVSREGLKPYPPKMENYRPAPLSPAKKPSAPPVSILPNPSIDGPVAGKESGVIDVNRWCALCERDGHESVDCPFEDAF